MITLLRYTRPLGLVHCDRLIQLARMTRPLGLVRRPRA